MHRLESAEYLVIAGEILGIDAARLSRQVNHGALDAALDAPFAGWAGHDVYPSLPQRAAVLCSRLIRNHPVFDGNKRAAYVAMLEFIFRNGGDWIPPDPLDAAGWVKDLAARRVSEEEFSLWVAGQLG